VEVQVQVQGGAEALDERDGAARAARSGPLQSSAPAKLGEERTDEGAQHAAREARVVGAAVAERVGKREHPLADRHGGEDAVREVRRGVGHAPSAAGGTEAAAFARERYEAVLPAVVAVHAQEAEGQDAAAQIGAELLLDEAGSGLAARASVGEEGLEPPLDDAIEDALLGAVACVDRGVRSRVVRAAIVKRRLERHPQAPVRGAYRVRGRLRAPLGRASTVSENGRSRPRDRRAFTRHESGERHRAWTRAKPER